MTALLAPRPSRKAPQRPQLRPVPRPRRRMSTVPFALVVALLLAGGMVGLLVLTTALQDQAFAVQAKQHEASLLATRLAGLQAQVADARSVHSLAVEAQELGMRPNPYGAQLRLGDGEVLGKAAPVMGGEVPGVRYLTPEQAAAQVKALDKAEAERKARAKAKAEAERKAKAEAERKARAEARAEAKAKAEAQAEREADAEARAKRKARG